MPNANQLRITGNSSSSSSFIASRGRFLWMWTNSFTAHLSQLSPNLISLSTYSFETPYIPAPAHTFNPPRPSSIPCSNTESTLIIQIYSVFPKVKFKWNIAVWAAPQNMNCPEWIPHLMHISGLLCCTTPPASMYERQVAGRWKLIPLSAPSIGPWILLFRTTVPSNIQRPPAPSK